MLVTTRQAWASNLETKRNPSDQNAFALQHVGTLASSVWQDEHTTQNNK